MRWFGSGSAERCVVPPAQATTAPGQGGSSSWWRVSALAACKRGARCTGRRVDLMAWLGSGDRMAAGHCAGHGLPWGER